MFHIFRLFIWRSLDRLGIRLGLEHVKVSHTRIEYKTLESNGSEDYWTKLDQDLGNVADMSDAAKLGPRGAGDGY